MWALATRGGDVATTAQSSVHPTSPASSWWFVSVPILAAPFLEKRAVGATSGLRALLSARDTTRGPQREDRGGHHVPRSSLGLTCPCSRTRRRGSKRLCGNPPQKKQKGKKKNCKKLLKQSKRRGLKPQRCLCRTPLRLQPWASRTGKEKIPCPAAGWEDGAAGGSWAAPGSALGSASPLRALGEVI